MEDSFQTRFIWQPRLIPSLFSAQFRSLHTHAHVLTPAHVHNAQYAYTHACTHMHAYHMHPHTRPHLHRHMHTYEHRRAHTLHSRFSLILTVGSRSGPRGSPAACTLASSRTDLSVTGHVLEALHCSALEASLSLHTALPFPLNRLHVFLWTWGRCLQPGGFTGATWAQATRAGPCSSPARKTSALGPLPMEAWIYFNMFPFWCFQPNFCFHPGSGPRHLWAMPTFPFS